MQCMLAVVARHIAGVIAGSHGSWREPASAIAALMLAGVMVFTILHGFTGG